MYCVYGNSRWYIHGGPLFGGGLLLGESVIGGSTVVDTTATSGTFELVRIAVTTCFQQQNQ